MLSCPKGLRWKLISLSCSSKMGDVPCSLCCWSFSVGNGLHALENDLITSISFSVHLKDYMDSKGSSVAGPSKAPADRAAMKRFVDSMLKDIRASYKSREEQLATAARGYKKRMKNLVKKHENLLIAYG